MGRSRDREKLIPQELLDRYKFEIAADLGLTDRIRRVGWADMTSRECGMTGGRIGGSITRVLVRRGQEALMRGVTTQQ